jgi:hypothetical protein
LGGTGSFTPTDFFESIDAQRIVGGEFATGAAVGSILEADGLLVDIELVDMGKGIDHIVAIAGSPDILDQYPDFFAFFQGGGQTDIDLGSLLYFERRRDFNVDGNGTWLNDSIDKAEIAVKAHTEAVNRILVVPEVAGRYTGTTGINSIGDGNFGQTDKTGIHSHGSELGRGRVPIISTPRVEGVDKEQTILSDAHGKGINGRKRKGRSNRIYIKVARIGSRIVPISHITVIMLIVDGIPEAGALLIKDGGADAITKSIAQSNISVVSRRTLANA